MLDRVKTNKQKNQEFFWKCMGQFCRHCGYDKSIPALQAHHIDKESKQGKKDTLSSWMNCSRSGLVDRVKRSKIIILCANCHAELHAGLWKIDESFKGDNLRFRGLSYLPDYVEKAFDRLVNENKG